MKVLVLELQHINESDQIQNMISYYKELGAEIEIIENVGNHDPAEVMGALALCDIMMFQSTWLNKADMRPFGKMLEMIEKPIDIMIYSLCTDTLEELEDTFKLEELAKMSHHRIYDVQDTYMDSEDAYSEIHMKSYQEKWDEEERIRVEKNKSFKRTGHRVLIKEVQATGQQWSLLKPGMVVDELDCREIDPNPDRGVWVMGKDEPVKLVNDSGYDEFEYLCQKEEKSWAWSITLTMLSKACKKTEDYLANYIASNICWAISPSSMNDSELWAWCTELCDEHLGIERRGNRQWMEQKLKEYRKSHTYFCEHKRTSAIEYYR